MKVLQRSFLKRENFAYHFYTKLLVFFILSSSEAKCYCTYTLGGQRNKLVNDSNEIMCEKNGGLQPDGKCSEDEYCAGPNTLQDAVCGKKDLCTKRGSTRLSSSITRFVRIVVCLNHNVFSTC